MTQISHVKKFFTAHFFFFKKKTKIKETLQQVPVWEPSVYSAGVSAGTRLVLTELIEEDRCEESSER